MTTYIVRNRRGKLVLRTTDPAVAENRRLLCGGTIQLLRREPTFGERWLAGRVAA
jgi:hypothetical protein